MVIVLCIGFMYLYTFCQVGSLFVGLAAWIMLGKDIQGHRMLPGDQCYDTENVVVVLMVMGELVLWIRCQLEMVCSCVIIASSAVVCHYDGLHS